MAPLRAVVCLLWMLGLTFGLAVFVFQEGALNWTGIPQLSARRDGAMNWMSPCIAFSVVVTESARAHSYFVSQEAQKTGQFWLLIVPFPAYI